MHPAIILLTNPENDASTVSFSRAIFAKNSKSEDTESVIVASRTRTQYFSRQNHTKNYWVVANSPSARVFCVFFVPMQTVTRITQKKKNEKSWQAEEKGKNETNGRVEGEYITRAFFIVSCPVKRTHSRAWLFFSIFSSFFFAPRDVCTMYLTWALTRKLQQPLTYSSPFLFYIYHLLFLSIFFFASLSTGKICNGAFVSTYYCILMELWIANALGMFRKIMGVFINH